MVAPALVGARGTERVELILPASAMAVRITPRDRAATRAYLDAWYTYAEGDPRERARRQAKPSSRLAHKVEIECPGVVAGAPRSKKVRRRIRRRRPRRARGEANRESRQLGDLELESELALALPEAELDAGAALQFDRTVRSLRWSSPAVTAYVHAFATYAEVRLDIQTARSLRRHPRVESRAATSRFRRRRKRSRANSTRSCEASLREPARRR